MSATLKQRSTVPSRYAPSHSSRTKRLPALRSNSVNMVYKITMFYLPRNYSNTIFWISSVSAPHNHPRLSLNQPNLHMPLLPLLLPLHHCDVWQLESVVFQQLRRPVRTKPTYHSALPLRQRTVGKGIRDGSQTRFVRFRAFGFILLVRMQDVLGLHDKRKAF